MEDYFVWYDESMAEQYIARINFSGSITTLLKSIVDEYGLGILKSFDPIEVGYEDYNVKLITHTGQYLVKIFAADRTNEECKRYVSVIEAILDQGVRHPKLIASLTSSYLVTLGDLNVRLIVMEWIVGDTYYDIERNPTEAEIDLIAQEAARINNIQIDLPSYDDDWSIDNIRREMDLVKTHLPAEEVARISLIIRKIEAVRKDQLPQGLVHGDLIKTNVLKSIDGHVYVLDFSVANNTARINELAILCCNLFFDETSAEHSRALYVRAVSAYHTYQRLTSYELEVLPSLIEAAHAMHIIGATKYEQVHGASLENDYWKNLGRTGLAIGELPAMSALARD